MSVASCSHAIMPADDAVARSTATDSAQPISNALYATYGIVPRMPLLNLVGLPERPEAFGSLPSGVVPVAFETVAGGMPGGGHDGLVRVIDGLDREIAGVAHPQDHRYLRMEGRHGWLYNGPDGVPLGYGYAGESGRLGPVAVHDPDLLAPVLGHLTSAVDPARRVRHLDRRRRRPRARPAAAGRFPTRIIPGPALLGPSLRGLLALPPDLAGVALARRPAVRRRRVRRGWASARQPFAGPQGRW